MATLSSSATTPGGPLKQPLHISDLKITFYLRGPENILNDPPQRAASFWLNTFLKVQFEDLQTAKLRSHHLSFEMMMLTAEKTFGGRMDIKAALIGWIMPPLSPGGNEEWFKISNERAFQNAIGVQHNICNQTGATAIELHIFRPIPANPVQRRPLLPEIVPEQNQEEAGGQIAEQEEVLEETEVTASVDTLKVSEEGTSAEDETVLGDDDDLSPLAETGADQEIPRSSPIPESEKRGGIECDMDALATQLDQELQKEGAPTQNQDESNEDFEQRQKQYQNDLLQARQQKFINSFDNQVIEHLSPERWVECCRFFNHNVEIKAAKYCVEVLHFQRQILPAQAYDTYWSLLEINGIVGSNFKGHTPGVGKTTCALLLFWAQHMINLTWDHIKNNPSDHFSAAEDQTTEDGAECASWGKIRKLFGIACPCSKKSPSHPFKQRLGSMAGMVPKILLNVWLQEAGECFPPSDPTNGINIHNMRVLKAHEGVNLREPERSIIKATQIPQWKPHEGIESNRNPKIPIYPKLIPRLENSSIFILTTSHSWDKKVEGTKNGGLSEILGYWIKPPDEQRIQRKATKTRAAGPWMFSPEEKWINTGVYFPVIFHTLIRDEFHLEKGQGSPTIRQWGRIIENQDKMAPTNRIALIPMSGTPLLSGPQDMAEYLILMAKAKGGWDKHNVLKDWDGNQARDLAKEWSDICRTGAMEQSFLDEILTKFTPIVERTMIRFHNKTNFLNAGVIVKVPKNIIRDIECDHSEEWNRELAKDKKAVDEEYQAAEVIRRDNYRTRFGNLRNYVPRIRNGRDDYYRSRLYASFPALMKIEQADGSILKLTQAEWQENTKPGRNQDAIWKRGTASDPYFTSIRKIALSSAKLTKIKEQLDIYSRKLDAKKKPVRQIFCSYFFVGAYVIYLYMTEVLKISTDDICYIDKTIPQGKIDKAIMNFQDQSDDTRKGKQPRYLIGTTSTFGLGITLAEATVLTLLEPDFRLATMYQVYARHCRQGNLNPITICNNLLAKGNAVEERITKVNNLRGKIEAAIARTANNEGDSIELDPDDTITYDDYMDERYK